MATVLHRTTKQLVKSAHTPNYPPNLWIHNPDLSTVSDPNNSKFWEIEGDSVREMTLTEKDTNYLAECKTEKCAEIKARTKELASQGFVFADKTFSLDDDAVDRVVGTQPGRDNVAFTYPLRWNTLDDMDVLDIANANTLHAFYLTALDTYRAHVDAATVLKDQIRAATTIAAVDAVVDSRS